MPIGTSFTTPGLRPVFELRTSRMLDPLPLCLSAMVGMRGALPQFPYTLSFLGSQAEEQNVNFPMRLTSIKQKRMRE